MNGQQLKNSILQLAIQGRLVPQDSNDEPASALLSLIREEKKKLVEEKKIKKDKPLAPIKDEEKPFEIPESWEWVRLGDIANYGDVKKKNKVTDFSRNIWSLDLEDIEKGGKLIKKIYLNERKSKGERTFFQKGDILYSKLRPYLQKILIADEDGACSTELVPFTCYSNISHIYICYCLKSNFIDNYIASKSFGIKMPRVSTETMTNLIIPLPPIAEQHRIVEKIEELLPLVEEYDEAQTKLDKLNSELPEKLKNSILQQAIMGRLDTRNDKDEPASALLSRIREEKKKLVEEKKIKKDKPLAPIKDEEKPFEIPESWEWVRLGDISQEISDGTHKTPKYVENGIPFLSVQNISSGKLNINKIKYISEDEHIKLIKRVKPQKNDILICRIGTLGRAIKVNWDFEFSIFVSLGLIRLIDSSLCNYLVACINSPLGYSWIDKVKVGGGTHTYKINLSDLPNFVIPLPPLSEQHRIVDKLEKIFEKIESMKK